MNNKPTVSIVSISYNHEPYISAALDGFIAQVTDFDFEIIIADDASTDNTAKIIKQYAKARPDIFRTILRQKNVGVVANLVGAMRAAKGKYLAICEGDDFWTDPLKLQRQVDFMDSHPQSAICFHPVQVIFQGQQKPGYIYPPLSHGNDFSLAALLRENFIQTNSVMYRRQDYSIMPDAIMPLDWYLHLFHAQFGSIGFIDEVMATYRKHPGGIWWEMDIISIWRKYGARHLGVYSGMLELFGHIPEYRQIISASILKLFTSLTEVDKTYGTTLLADAAMRFPDETRSFLLGLDQEFEALKLHSNEQGSIIKHWVARSASLEVKLANLEATKAVRLQKHLKRLRGQDEH